jgi:hypothetical protein
MYLTELNKSPDIRRGDLPFPILTAHQPEFMPWLGNISKAAASDVYFILDTVQYGKELFQNRNKIRIHGDKGWQWLTIPTRAAKQRLLSWNDVYINNSYPWKQKHLNAIKYSYSRAKYFDEIYTEVETIYKNFHGEKLIDIVTDFIYYAHEKFELSVPVYRTSMLDHEFIHAKTDLILEMCEVAGAKSFIFGALGRNYIQKEKFMNIHYRFQNFEHPTYTQLHGEFLSHMCFLDVLFNHGSQSIHILNKSKLDVA